MRSRHLLYWTCPTVVFFAITRKFCKCKKHSPASEHSILSKIKSKEFKKIYLWIFGSKATAILSDRACFRRRHIFGVDFWFFWVDNEHLQIHQTRTIPGMLPHNWNRSRELSFRHGNRSFLRAKSNLAPVKTFTCNFHVSFQVHLAEQRKYWLSYRYIVNWLALTARLEHHDSISSNFDERFRIIWD